MKKKINYYKEENSIEYNSKWSQIPDHWYTVLIIAFFWTWKQTDYLLSLVTKLVLTFNIFLYA